MRERENSNSSSLLYQTPEVYVQGGGGGGVLTVSKAVHKCRSAWQFMLFCSSLKRKAWKM